MSGSNRPMSPHLQVYRPQLTSVLSITHRATGVGLAAGTIFLVWWIMAAAAGPDYFGFVQEIMGSWLGLLILLGFSWAVFYHLCNGIRHLFWDAGYGFDLETAYKSGWATLAGSVVLTVIAWAVGCSNWA
jgi:succinate dehydrogenase / fumarate reductase, cytochrome b subunit